jgi:hypothetical protein
MWNVSALSGGAYTTTLLVMDKLSPPLLLCPSKIFRHRVWRGSDSSDLAC